MQQLPIVTVDQAPNALTLIDVARARLQCRISSNVLDPVITDAINAARDYVQERTQRAIGVQRLTFTYPQWRGCALLPFDITQLLAVTVDGVAEDPLPTPIGRLIELSDAYGKKVAISIETGYTPATLPGALKQAMLLLIADAVRNPAAQVETTLHENKALETLLYPYIRSLPV
jgi:hypothetical protein